MNKKNLYKCKNTIWCQKTQNIMLIFNPLKKLQNSSPKKDIFKKIKMNKFIIHLLSIENIDFQFPVSML
jgi:hypothetical protein